MNDTMTLSQRADALEQQMSDELDYIVIKSRLYSLAEADMSPAPNAGALMAKNPKARVLMGDDPRLPAMPEKPTLLDFFHYRFGPATHDMQSARHAVNAGLPERWCSPACCTTSTMGLIRGDHGYWGAQWSSPMSMRMTGRRAHQVLRFYPDRSVGYEYPRRVKTFGADYRRTTMSRRLQADAHHKWYMSGRMITVHDIYSFDRTCMSSWRIHRRIGRNFRQPKEGLSRQQPVALMWRR
jgi:hypothetical protein